MLNYVILTTHFSHIYSIWDFTHTCNPTLSISFPSPKRGLKLLSCSYQKKQNSSKKKKKRNRTELTQEDEAKKKKKKKGVKAVEEEDKEAKKKKMKNSELQIDTARRSL